MEIIFKVLLKLYKAWLEHQIKNEWDMSYTQQSLSRKLDCLIDLIES